MRFGVFYELQLPKPWNRGDERRLFGEALEQIVLADRHGIDYAWCVEHHFLEEYSHCSAPEVFLAAAAARTERIRLGHGIRQVIPRYNHPARTAETLATLDLISDGRVDFGIGEGATRLELRGFGIGAKEKRALAIEAAEQIADMMVMTPYPGYDGAGFRMPCRNVLPKPLQQPHPPMWMACTNRETIKVAASLGLGALAFSFVDPDEARSWTKTYYDIVKSDACVPVGHTVNANVAMVSAFSLHADRAEAVRRGQEGFEFFAFALRSLVTRDTVPGRTDLWGDFLAHRREAACGGGATADDGVSLGDVAHAPGIGTPDDFIAHARSFQEAGVDQIILLQQAGNNTHAEICAALDLFAAEVLPRFAADRGERERAKAEELAPAVAAALARKTVRAPLADDEIPVVEASVDRVRVNRGRAAT